MRAVFKAVAPYKQDAMNLPVANVEAAIPFYEERMGFHVVARRDAPVRSVVLARDHIQIGLAENGGDSSQEGCFFEVDDVEAAFEEVKGAKPADGAIETQTFGSKSFRVFFVVAPDGLCYMLAQPEL
jgi:catechol 2,3-dioxygenase-like lactoylglutathione lyase family enzyme